MSTGDPVCPRHGMTPCKCRDEPQSIQGHRTMSYNPTLCEALAVLAVTKLTDPYDVKTINEAIQEIVNGREDDGTCPYCGEAQIHKTDCHIRRRGKSVLSGDARVVGLPPRLAPPPTELEGLTAERDNLRRALSFYAEREHYAFSGEPDDWEAASGEPQNWLCAPTIPPHDKDFDPSWMIEDGGIARAALAGEYVEPSEVGRPPDVLTPARELLYLYDWRPALATMEKALKNDGTDSKEEVKRVRGLLREYGERKKAGWIALRAALEGSDARGIANPVVGGVQLTQGGGDSAGMPLSVGRSRPDQTATNSDNAPGVACHGWTPVSERLPDDGVVVLVRVAGTPIDNPSPWVGSGHYVRDEFADVMRWEVAGTFGWGSPVKVTHWKPLDADVARPAEDFVVSVRHLVFQARTSGGTAGRDEGLCAALDRVEALLPPPQIEPSPVEIPKCDLCGSRHDKLTTLCSYRG